MAVKKETKKTLQEVYQEKSERLLNGVAYWGAYYRKNPQRFVKDYLNIDLKWFQKILIYVMMASTNFMFVASRGYIEKWLDIRIIYVYKRAKRIYKK